MQVYGDAAAIVTNNMKVLETLQRLSREGKHLSCFIDTTDYYHSIPFEDERTVWVLIDQVLDQLPDDLSDHLHYVADATNRTAMGKLHGLFDRVFLEKGSILAFETPYKDLGCLLKPGPDSHLYIEARPGFNGHVDEEPSEIDVESGTYRIVVNPDCSKERRLKIWNQELRPTLVSHLETLFAQVTLSDESKYEYFLLEGPKLDALPKKC